jgi:diadenosine tetraphosphate (Ap4A) HIT family hydrolase
MIGELLKDLPKNIQKKLLLSILKKSAENFAEMDMDKQLELYDTLQKLKQDIDEAMTDMKVDFVMITEALEMVVDFYETEARNDAQTAAEHM